MRERNRETVSWMKTVSGMKRDRVGVSGMNSDTERVRRMNRMRELDGNV